MKRSLTLLLSALLLLFSLSGCAEKTALDPKKPVTLTLWHVYGEQADSPMNRLVEEFNSTVGQEKGIIVTVTNVSSSSKITAQLQEAMSGKPGAPEMPDLFSGNSSTVAELGAEKLLDWNTYFSKDELASYVPEFLNDGTMDGKLMVFPVSKSTYALFLNGSQFERFSADTGVTYDTLSTWEGFFDAAAKYYDWSDGKPFCAFDYLQRAVELNAIEKGAKPDELYKDGYYDFDNTALKAGYEPIIFQVPPLREGRPV